MNVSPRAEPAVRDLLLALVPVAVLVALLYVNVQVFKSETNHIPLVVASTVGAAIAVFVLKKPWRDIEDGIIRSIGMAMQAIIILLVIGMLIAAWIKSGVVPLLIVYGLKSLSPGIFAVTACFVCCIVSLATGSSWTTAGTVGVALIGAGKAMGLDPGLVAGAIVSGAYFGDKMSPLSDTTNLAPAMAGANLIEHIRHMAFTVAPALVIALVLYAVLGKAGSEGGDVLSRIDATVHVLESEFVLSPWLLIPPALVLVLVARRMAAIPSLIFGTFGAVVLGLLVQRSGPPGSQLGAYAAQLYAGAQVATAAALSTDAPQALRDAAANVDQLLNGRGGLESMLPTVALIFCALAFGGVMERSGMLGAITGSIMKLVRGTGTLVAATIFTCFGVNVLASDQYMAIVLPGRMFRRAYLDRGLHPKNLSRALEDSGTVTSALIPWNTCGLQMATVLGVATFAYAPWAFLNWLCPLISIVYGATGFTITRLTPEEARIYGEE